MTEEQPVNTDQLMQAYYATLKDGMASFDEERLRRILAPDLVFEGPIAGRHVGAEGFIQGVAGFAGTMRGLTMLQQLHAGSAAATLYDAEIARRHRPLRRVLPDRRRKDPVAAAALRRPRVPSPRRPVAPRWPMTTT